MSDWTAGYRACLGDVERMAEGRFATHPARFRAELARLLTDLRGDMSAIEHADLNTQQRAALDAERAAIVPRQGALL